jgi:hypothetical protein
MAEAEKTKFDIPWGTLLPLIAILGGIIAQYKPLISERPAAPGEKAVEVIAEQDVDARLWQDPVAVARKEKEAHKAEAKPNKQIESLALSIKLHAKSESPDHILLLAVMLDAGPYIEQSESRLRSRQAVLQALSEGKFVPADGEHIGFVTAPWPPDNESIASEEGLLLPWERWEPADEFSSRVYPPDTRAIFVLWLPAGNFTAAPLARFATLINWLTKDLPPSLRDNIDIKLIGPLNSRGLQDMLAEVRDQGVIPDAARNDALDGVWIISPRATMSDDALLYHPRSLSSKLNSAARPDQQVPLQVPLKESVEKEIENSGPTGLRFIRTVARDDLVLGTLIEELKVRGIDVSHQDQEDGDKVVVLTEWDSPYGRSLATTFAALASNQGYSDLIEEPDLWPKRILSYRYLRGIDGRLPGEQAKTAGAGAENKPKGEGTVQPKPEEATEGMDQSDYLRRLARKLKKEDLISQRENKGRMRAIGLLGADIYDKLMILRALRPEFPDAIFFTNNFDAHFERHADWSDVRNLIIVSPFGSTLPGWQENTAPFRDSAQTAMYAGTLVATKKIDEKQVVKFTKHPKIFEIGRRGAWDLSRSSPNETWFRDWVASFRVQWRLTVGSLALLAMIGWISMNVVDRKLPGGGSSWERLRRVAANTPVWLVCGVPVIVFSVAWYSQHWREPLAFFSGISIWPSEMLRLIALLLAIHFMIKASLSLKSNEREIAKRFGLGDLIRARVRWRNLWEGPQKRREFFEQLGLTRWQKEHAKWLEPEAQFSAEEAWHAYLRRNRFWPRFIRIGALFIIYFIFSFAVFTLFPPIIAPARGLTALTFDKWVLLPSVIGMLILSFYVFDALQLNSNFIRMFTRGVTKWAPDVSKHTRREPPLTDAELSRYHDILFVAQRTEAVAPLIWYPLVVLAVMILARSPFFDDWTWPLRLILIFALNAMWAFGSAVFLRRAAEQLRETAISNLQLSRASSYLSGVRRRTFDELIAEIRGLRKGAFAPLSEQPFVRAILLPSGGLGLLALAQRLLVGF